MAFDKNNASENGRKGGKRSAATRWGGRDPDSVRNQNVRLAVTKEELAMIDDKAAQKGVSRVELIVRAVREYST